MASKSWIAGSARLLQPSLKSLLGLRVTSNPALLDGSFAARYPFQNLQTLLEGFETTDVHEICGRDAVLRNKHWRAIFRELGENLGGLPF